MNLFAITAPLVSAVNPRERVTVYASTGSTTDADGGRTPSYGAGVSVLAQIQELTHTDLMMLDGLNIQAETVVMYLPGKWSAASRADQKGGDRIIRADGTNWLLTVLDESWQGASGWCRIIATRQVP
jgi:hypothetical protein